MTCCHLPPAAAAPLLGHCASSGSCITRLAAALPANHPAAHPVAPNAITNMKRRARAQNSTIVRTQLCSASLLEVPTDSLTYHGCKENYCVEGTAHTQQAAAADAAVQQEGCTHATASGMLADRLRMLRPAAALVRAQRTGVPAPADPGFCCLCMLPDACVGPTSPWRQMPPTLNLLPDMPALA
jgi:hypothetical protein